MFTSLKNWFSKESHTHEWEPIIKTIIEPRNVTVPGDATLSRLALTGSTTYLFQCSLCKDLRKEQCEGVEERALDRLMDKVDIGGPEYILRDGKTYILMQYRKQESLENIPVR